MSWTSEGRLKVGQDFTVHWQICTREYLRVLLVSLASCSINNSETLYLQRLPLRVNEQNTSMDTWCQSI